MRSYGGETDLQAIADLLNACEVVDQFDNWTSISELRQDFDEPGLDKARDIRLWEDAQGNLIGYSGMWIPPAGEALDGFLGFSVHPEARGGTLERQMIAWGEQRMREVASERGVSVKLRCGTRDDKSDRITLLESCGFTADRYFLRMARGLKAEAERSLFQPIPEPKFPEGFALRQLQGEQDVEAWVEMFNQSFIDHWNFHPLTVENRKHWLTDINYKPELDLIAVAPDGTFAALCYCYIPSEENECKGRRDGWIADLATRRGFRRMGLGRAMLLAGMHQLKAAGIETVKLAVDADNPNGARQLYESVGFRKLHTSIAYSKDVSI